MHGKNYGMGTVENLQNIVTASRSIYGVRKTGKNIKRCDTDKISDKVESMWMPDPSFYKNHGYEYRNVIGNYNCK